MSDQLQIEVRDSLAEVPAAQWNALDSHGNPFLRHEFLHTLEATGCLGDATGWYPRYFLLWADRHAAGPATSNDTDAEHADADDADSLPSGATLLAAVPTYVKTNSYGEFVFDWAWASAYERHSLDYYPKLVAAIPFTPATGQRLLVHPDQSFTDLAPLLAAAVRQFADHEEYSGVHWLFVTEAENTLLCQGEGTPAGDHLARIDCQYHWHNDNYTSFEHFLSQCTSKRRKTIRRERRHVSDAGLAVQTHLGSELSPAQWAEVHALYASTYDRKWGNPSLSAAFFRQIGECFGDRTLIVLAHDPADASPERAVACSIMFIGDDTLYAALLGLPTAVQQPAFRGLLLPGHRLLPSRMVSAAFRTRSPGGTQDHAWLRTDR